MVREKEGAGEEEEGEGGHYQVAKRDKVEEGEEEGEEDKDLLAWAAEEEGGEGGACE